ncbi:glycosyltransferase [Actinokineospora spheciospongiae]|uniref:glycosyltransferase n=1 Tax=Actinokineospora spheciospongiae TaxID=909613 RepID=UPI000D716141|nr:glycosyltransferase [Actinokineospora spheciospongiae]PWW60480.1 N-glycosyltransferase [Actinokineospora spheciospongiae]
MKVFSSVTGSHGHARAVLPVVRALADAGHEVLVATPRHLAEVFEDEPLRVEPVMPDMAQIILQLRAAGTSVLTDEGIDPRLALIALASGPHVTATFNTTHALAEEWGAELVVRDGAELSAVLVAEALGVPHVSAPSGAGNITDAAGIVEALDERRDEVGLPAQDDPFAIYRHGRLDCLPAEYSFGAFPMPEAFAYRQPTDLDRGRSLPADLAAIPGDKPLVLASVGTALPVVLNMEQFGIDLPEDMLSPADTVRAIVHGLSKVDCYAVVASGGFPPEDSDFGDHVLVVDHIPQPLLLESTAAFLTHGGYNSIRESIRAGVPMAVLPQFGDQHHNATRVQDLGLGHHITDVTPDGVAAAVTHLLEDEKTRATTTTAQRRTTALPGVDAVVAHLESLARA